MSEFTDEDLIHASTASDCHPDFTAYLRLASERGGTPILDSYRLAVESNGPERGPKRFHARGTPVETTLYEEGAEATLRLGSVDTTNQEILQEIVEEGRGPSLLPSDPPPGEFEAVDPPRKHAIIPENALESVRDDGATNPGAAMRRFALFLRRREEAGYPLVETTEVAGAIDLILEQFGGGLLTETEARERVRETYDDLRGLRGVKQLNLYEETPIRGPFGRDSPPYVEVVFTDANPWGKRTDGTPTRKYQEILDRHGVAILGGEGLITSGEKRAKHYIGVPRSLIGGE
jgi:hypothetical protein